MGRNRRAALPRPGQAPWGLEHTVHGQQCQGASVPPTSFLLLPYASGPSWTQSPASQWAWTRGFVRGSLRQSGYLEGCLLWSRPTPGPAGGAWPRHSRLPTSAFWTLPPGLLWFLRSSLSLPVSWAPQGPSQHPLLMQHLKPGRLLGVDWQVPLGLRVLVTTDST